ncbi:MAG: DedA family protein [Bryobacteraceae bacterium]
MIERELLAHGYLIVFLGTLFEADATLLAAAFLARRGYLEMPLVMLLAVLTSSAVSHGVFFLARRRGVAAFERKAATNPRWRKLQQTIEKRGPWLLLFSRFLFGLRSAIAGACAASGIRPAVFSVMDLSGAILWAIVFGVGGFYFGHGLELMIANIRRHELDVALAIFLVVLLILWRRQKREMVETVEAFTHPTEHSLHSVEEVGEKLGPGGPDEPSS